MSKEIDLEKYQIRTDLAIDVVNTDNIKTTVKNIDNIKITNIYIDEKNSQKINKKVGNYITIEYKDITDYDNGEKVKKIFTVQLQKLLKQTNIKVKDTCLIVGLGNERSTPDALGPLVIKKIIVTKHLFEIGQVSKGFRCTSAITPGVMGQTGIETSDLIISIVKTTKPNFLIVIDALASQSIERLNKTIQMTDTGIHPGSGIGNKRKEISKETIKIPVIAIGIPTVVDAVTIVSDTINYMHKQYTYTKQNINNPLNKLIPVNTINYLNQNILTNQEDKMKLFGLIGSLNATEVKQLIFEVLTPIGYNLMVTSKEVDFLMEKQSKILACGINNALHLEVND
ncbi:MAG: GPR endopeptidase [Bacilli bacterium]